MNILITGHSRGIGAALCDTYLEQGQQVFALARGRLERPAAALRQGHADFAVPERLPAALDALVDSDTQLDLVYLNAGVLGPFGALSAIDLEPIREVMNINVWANKIILDWLISRASAPAQIILMSSGASISAGYGWGTYALSKATLNMLAMAYAHELPASHLTAFAPGLVDTAMQADLRTHSAREFPSLARLHAAQGTASMPAPLDAARRIAALCPRFREHPSGSFLDLRKDFEHA